MWFKYPIIILLFWLLAILQNSFFAYFSTNLIFILFFVIIFFENKKSYNMGFWVTIISGFFLDIFLPSYFGISIISLLIIYFLEKLTIHFLKDSQNKSPIFYFIPLFLICFIVYNSTLTLFALLLNFQFNFLLNIGIFSLFINLVISCAGFYIYDKFIRKGRREDQLKLL